MIRNNGSNPNGSAKLAISPGLIESVTAYTPWKKSLVLTLGTTGCRFAETLIQVCPEMADTIVGVDTAAPTSGEEQGTAPPWMIELKPQDLRSLVHSPLPFFGHERWRELEYPRRVDHGAGAARAIGAAFAAPEFSRIRQRIRQCLVQVLQDPPPSGIVPVLVVAGGGGGTGSSLMSIVAYLVQQEARMIAPGIEIRVEVMLILDPYYHAIGFQGTERERGGGRPMSPRPSAKSSGFKPRRTASRSSMRWTSPIRSTGHRSRRCCRSDATRPAPP